MTFDMYTGELPDRGPIALMKRVLFPAIVIVLLLSTGCGSGCDVQTSNGDWTYVQRREWRLRGSVCVSELRYRREHIWAGRTLITPLGTFAIQVSEHGDEDHGWTKIAETTSNDVPTATAQPISKTALADGFYAGGPESKLRGTPPDWIYIGGVEQPGWAAPAKLRDRPFIEQHRPILTREP